jgi:hypothetical protein
VIRFLRALLGTLAAIAIAAFAILKSRQNRGKQREHEERAATAKRDHKLAEARRENDLAKQWEKRADVAKAKAEKRIDDATDRHETPELDEIVSEYNRRARQRMRERAGDSESVD